MKPRTVGARGRPATIPPKQGQGKGAAPKARKTPTRAVRGITWQEARVEATATGWRFTMPVVTSANRQWRMGKGRTYKSDEANADVTGARLMFRHIVPLYGDLSVSITWYRSQKAGDVDNRIKATLDLLRGIAYADDASVARVSCERVDDGSPARLVVDVDNFQRRNAA